MSARENVRTKSMTLPLNRPRGLMRHLYRAAAVVLVPAQVLLAVPVYADPSPDPNPSPEPEAVVVNKTVPEVEPVPAPAVSENPTDAEITAQRIFGEPLVPIGDTTPEINHTFAAALRTFIDSQGTNFGVLESYLQANPQSPWRVALLANLGVYYRNQGYFGRAEVALAEAWQTGKDDDTMAGRKITNKALSELLHIHMAFGHQEELERLTDEAEGREMTGASADQVWRAKASAWGLAHQHELAVPSGPMALAMLRERLSPGAPPSREIKEFHATPQGATMRQIRDLAQQAGLDLQVAYRESASVPLILPSVAHLRDKHYTAVVEERDGRVLLKDGVLGGDAWILRGALDEESTGLFLVPAGDLPPGWRAAHPAEAQQARGKCHFVLPGGWLTGWADHFCEDCDGGGAPGGAPPMAIYRFHTLLANLHITDTPVRYSPPRGPFVGARVNYNHKELYQPATFTFSNMSPRWSLDWISYVEDDPSNALATVQHMLRGGGRQSYDGWVNGVSAPDERVHAVLVRTQSSPIEYELRHADGSVEVFSESDGALVMPRRVFMTESRDPQGNAITFTYDSQLRLVSVTDAIGQVTTLSYEIIGDPLKVTKITDPFGRAAKFHYDASGRLAKITDVIGIESEFTYSGTFDFIQALTTPYGTTQFSQGKGLSPTTDYYLEATDPLGGRERIEFVASHPTLPATESAVPTGFVGNSALNLYNSFYWNKRALALHPGDYTKAHITRWLLNNTYVVSGVKHSEKKPLESRVWYGQAHEAVAGWAGPSGQPAKIGRVLDDGSSQIYRYEYNSKGHKTRVTDPMGRETRYTYATNGIDLLKAEQKNGSGWDTLETRTYNSVHQPLTITDTAGQTTTYTYNSNGTLATVVTPPRGGLSEANRTTSHSYFADNATYGPGRLQTVTAPLSATTSFTYDSYGRVRTTTGSDSYALTVDYDALDRPVKTTYPDSTYEEIHYFRLDGERTRDRAGRWTQRFMDSLRREVAVRDPLGRTTSQQWCDCGTLEKITDANGNTTRWEHDLQGRITKEVRANGGEWLYTYENTTSRLKQVTDPEEQVKSIQYFNDDKLKQVSYTNANYTTPTVSFTYDAPLGRLASMTDGTGMTNYSYNTIGGSPAVGAGQLHSVDGPGASDTITYGYDELGRRVSRALDSQTTTFAFDALDRVATVTHPVGTFTYGYAGATERRVSLSYPNGTSTTYSYLSGTNDRHIQEIHHKFSGGATLSKQSYVYDVAGNITTWTQQDEASAAKAYDLAYDAADQLVRAVYRTTDATPTVLKRYGYAYDPLGNRTTEGVDDAVTQGTFNTMNRLTTRQPGGALTFAGSTNETASVTVQGKPATTTGSNAFAGAAQVGSGTSTVVVVAKDPSGNAQTNNYQVSISGGTTNYSYDANGNLSQKSDGTDTWTYDWYADNTLARVSKNSAEQARFVYDGHGRRYQKVVGATTTTYTYDAEDVLREATNTATSYGYVHGPGIDEPLGRKDESASVIYYHADHLGSILKTTNGGGSVATTRRYDPFGNLEEGAGEGGFAFTGRDWDSEIGFYHLRARYYDPKTGRFTSEDPIHRRREAVTPDVNLYRYVLNIPTRLVDPNGEIFCLPGVGEIGALYLFVRKRAEAHRVFPHNSDGKDWTRDREQHCWAACKMRRWFPCSAVTEVIMVLRPVISAATGQFGEAENSGGDAVAHYWGDYKGLVFFWRECKEICETCPFRRPPGGR